MTSKAFILLKVVLLLLCITTINFSHCYAQKVVNMESLLKEMVNTQSVTYFPVPYYTTSQASSYDRKSVAADQPGWFSNSDFSQFIRKENNGNRTEHVMMDADGPGALVRFWLTTFKRDGNIRIYFDHHTKPDITIPAYDLMKFNGNLGKGILIPHSSYQPLEKGGSTLYLPMPYAKHCKVTWEDAEDPIKQPRYYQINYRTYAQGTRVQTFSLKQLESAASLLNSTSDHLLHPKVSNAGKISTLQRTITPGAKQSIQLPAGTNSINELILKLSDDNSNKPEQIFRSTLLNIEFDGQPTVSSPVGDFSGSGFGNKPIHSWYRTVNTDGDIISRWVMPYQKNATVTIENTGTETIKVELKISTSKYKWTKNSMYFHAQYKYSPKVPIKKWDHDGAIDWNILKLEGAGVFMGDTFAVFNHMNTWYGEGDQKIYSDNEQFPIEFGTGAEDYFNTSWAPVVLYNSPFANAPRADKEDSYGHNTFTRTRNLDGVPFKATFRYDLEMLGWADGAADCAATSYWYQIHTNFNKQ